jgi:uncharacterized membrane protein
LKTRILLFIVVVANAVGNILLGFGMKQVGSIASYSPIELVRAGLGAMANPWVLAGVALLLVFFVSHTIVLSWADLSYVLLVTSIGYVLVVLLSWRFLGETITVARWLGTIVITGGVMLVGSTPVSTSTAAQRDRGET